jgi:glyoxylase-like metal-dependent hydrolase (beta-lactamase superfamily II)
MKQLVLAVVAGGFLLQGAASAQETENLEFDVLPLAGSVYLLRCDTKIGNPSTVVSVGEDGVLIVDPSLDLVSGTLLPAIEALGDGPIRFVTATHFHGDHTENFEMLAQEVPEAVAFVPAGLRKQLATGAVFHGERPLVPEALPVMTFEKQVTLHLNGDMVEVSTLPNPRGHTDSDAVIYFREANVLCVGDYLFLERYPILDDSGDLEGYLANIAWMLETYPSDAVVVPGHGRFRPDPVEAADMAALGKQLAMLRESIEVIRERLADGANVDEIVAAGLPETFAGYDAKPRYVSEERWIRFVAAYYR